MGDTMHASVAHSASHGTYDVARKADVKALFETAPLTFFREEPSDEDFIPEGLYVTQPERLALCDIVAGQRARCCCTVLL